METYDVDFSTDDDNSEDSSTVIERRAAQVNKDTKLAPRKLVQHAPQRCMTATIPITFKNTRPPHP